MRVSKISSENIRLQALSYLGLGLVIIIVSDKVVSVVIKCSSKYLF